MAVKIRDDLERMQEELKAALKKPAKERSWVMVLDRKKCVGCQACTVACKSENVTPPGVAYTVVWEEEIGRYPNVRKRFTPPSLYAMSKTSLRASVSSSRHV